MTHRTIVRVRFGELDPYSHVNHAVYVAWFEAGRGEALHDVGMSLGRMAESGWQMVVTDLHVAYRIPAVAGDEVTIETIVSDIRGATCAWRQRALRAGPSGEDVVLCVAELRAGVTDLHGRPMRMSADVKSALALLAAPAEPPV